MKAYDSLKYNIISLALRRIATPEKYVKSVEKLHGDFKVILNIDREEVCIRYGCRVY